MMRGFVILLLLAAASVTVQPATAQTRQRCFPETGQCISGRFLEYWEQNGGVAIFGFPISSAADEIDRDSGQTYRAQWFERSRFVLRPGNRAPYDVVLDRLGDQRLMQLGQHWQAFPTQPPSDPHYFAETGHAIDYAPFWAFWSTHGLELDGKPGTSTAESVALFGLPISRAVPTTNINGDLVLAQWFERARLEYHPNNPEPYKVLLGLLGAAVRLNESESPIEDTTSEPIATGVQIVQQGFGQRGQRVGFGAILHNDQDRVVERVEYDIKLLDASGAVVGRDAHFVLIMYPYETVGIGNEIVVDAGVQVASIELQLAGGRLGASEFADFESNPLSAEQVSYRSGGPGQKIGGTIRNRLPAAIQDIRIDGIAYDSSGAIIGGGFAYADLVPASGTAAVEVLITAASTPASVELYPTLTIESDIGDAEQSQQ